MLVKKNGYRQLLSSLIHHYAMYKFNQGKLLVKKLLRQPLPSAEDLRILKGGQGIVRIRMNNMTYFQRNLCGTGAKYFHTVML